jgi:elongation factor 1-alpha
VTIIDAPGHKDFIKNMITGTSQADAGILIVSASKGEFEAGISKTGSTREHVMLAYTLGVRQLIVAVNKMDSESVQFSEKRFTEIRTEISAILKKIGFSLEKVVFVPISGWTGENLTEATTNMRWYTGPTLIDTIDMLETPSRPNDKPLRIPVQDVFKVPGVGTIVTGRVDSGTLKSGQSIQIAPVGIVSEVKSIEMHHSPIFEAVCGM